MKKPLYNLEERQIIRVDCYVGDKMLLRLAKLKFCRDISKTKEFISIVKVLEYITNYIYKHLS